MMGISVFLNELIPPCVEIRRRVMRSMGANQCKKVGAYINPNNQKAR